MSGGASTGRAKGTGAAKGAGAGTGIGTPAYSAIRTRRVGLLAALADDPDGLREDWIHANVAGYAGVSGESADRYLRDDVAALASMGITVDRDPRSSRLRLDRASFLDADPGFTEAEADVLAIASRVAFDDTSLKELSTGAWLKLAPVARRSDLHVDRGTVVLGDRVNLDARQLADLTHAMQPPRTRVDFYYAPQLFAEEVLRTIEPWAIINRKGRWYVVGHDVDREEVRTFRLSRMVDVTVTGSDATVPIPDEDMRIIADRTLRRGTAPITGIVRLADDARAEACADVLATARPTGDGAWEIGPVTPAELIDIGLDHAGDLVVVQPVEVRDAIVAKLRSIIAADAATGAGTAGEES